MTALAATTSAPARHHWSAAVAAIIAMATLWICEPRFIGLGLLGVAAAISAIFRLRPLGHPLIVWLVRATLFAAIYLTALNREYTGSPWTLDQDFVNLFGYLCAAELVVQFWQRRQHPSDGEILVLTMLVFATGCGTFENDIRWARSISPVKLITPAFIVVLAISMRRFRARSLPAQPRSSARFTGACWATTALALAIGLTAAVSLRAYGERVTIYPLHGIFKKGPQLNSVGLSQAPQLGPSNNGPPLLARVLRLHGPLAEAHLRAMSFDTYQFGAWLPLDTRQFEPVSRPQLAADAPGPRVEVTRLAAIDGLLASPLWAAGIRTASDSQMVWEEGRALREQAMREPLTPYEIILGPDSEHQGPLCLPPTPDHRARYLAVPRGMQARLRELTDKIAAQPEPRQRIAAIEKYLLSNYTYTLDIPLAAGDPLLAFLFNRRSGHCQYFASAMVMLARTANVPARMVTGFYAHERGGDNVITVRQRDAHAWAEVWLDGVGWVTVDATPSSGRPDALYGDAARWQRFQEWVQDKFDALKAWLASLGWMRIAMVIAIAVAAISMFKWLLGILAARRQRRPPLKCLYPEGDLAAVAIAFDQLLRRLGRACAAQQTWSEHLASLDGLTPRRLDIQLAREFILRYQQARFGNARPPSALADLHGILGRLDDGSLSQ